MAIRVQEYLISNWEKIKYSPTIRQNITEESYSNKDRFATESAKINSKLLTSNMFQYEYLDKKIKLHGFNHASHVTVRETMTDILNNKHISKQHELYSKSNISAVTRNQGAQDSGSTSRASFVSSLRGDHSSFRCKQRSEWLLRMMALLLLLNIFSSPRTFAAG